MLLYAKDIKFIQFKNNKKYIILHELNNCYCYFDGKSEKEISKDLIDKVYTIQSKSLFERRLKINE